ncbi:MAG: hypothetical protein LUD50_05885 [Clostridia bacterium]|nr:hypothetical protein [Clostridia bacterium]
MTGHEYTSKTSEELNLEPTPEEKKKMRREKTKRFFKELFTKRLGLKLLAVVLAFVMVMLINL